jgi:hypothetical protein
VYNSKFCSARDGRCIEDEGLAVASASCGRLDISD